MVRRLPQGLRFSDQALPEWLDFVHPSNLVIVIIAFSRHGLLGGRIFSSASRVLTIYLYCYRRQETNPNLIYLLIITYGAISVALSLVNRTKFDAALEERVVSTIRWFRPFWISRVHINYETFTLLFLRSFRFARLLNRIPKTLLFCKGCLFHYPGCLFHYPGTWGRLPRCVTTSFTLIFQVHLFLYLNLPHFWILSQYSDLE